MNNDFDFQLHLDRVHKHFTNCINNPDKIALLDLSHSLRIWTDLKDKIDYKKYPKTNSPIFTAVSPNKTLCGIAKKCFSVIAYFPKGAYTFVNNGKKIINTGKLIPGKPFMIAARANTISGKELVIHDFLFIEKLITDDERKDINIKKVITSKQNFKNWMGSEIVRIYNYKENAILTISREKMITRLANSFDASHPKDQNDELQLVDEIITKLFDFSVGELPLPYYILLSISKDLLIYIPKVFDLPNYEDILLY